MLQNWRWLNSDVEDDAPFVSSWYDQHLVFLDVFWLTLQLRVRVVFVWRVFHERSQPGLFGVEFMAGKPGAAKQKAAKLRCEKVVSVVLGLSTLVYRAVFFYSTCRSGKEQTELTCGQARACSFQGTSAKLCAFYRGR